MFVAVGYYDNLSDDLKSYATIFTSTDGASWIEKTSGGREYCDTHLA